MACKNILVIGRTGAGKSSLVNYLAGRPLAEVGVGRPVTTRDDVTSYTMMFMGVAIRLFDSWGIEADKTDDWRRRTMKIVSDHGEFTTDDSSWFHTVVYCISAASARVESVDVEMIEYFRGQSFSVVVVLTNADRCSDDDMNSLEHALPSGLDVVRISSGGRTRFGYVEPFGKEQLLASVVRSTLRNLPKRTENRLKADVEYWRQDMIGQLCNKDVSRFSNWGIERWIKNSAEAHAKRLNDTLASFVEEEVRTVVVWNQNVSQNIQGCDVHVHLQIARELSGWCYASMVACVPLLLVVGIGFMIFGSVEEERRKLRETINDAARQMNEFVEKAVADFSHKVAFAQKY